MPTIADLKVGLVSGWPCAEGAGASLADKVDANTGTLGSNIAWSTIANGNCLSNPSVNVNGYVDFGTATNLVPGGDGHLSISIWFASTITWGTQLDGARMFNRTTGVNATEDIWYLEYYGGAAYFVMNDAGSNYQLVGTSGFTPATNAVHNLTAVWDASNITLYVDGAYNNAAAHGVDGFRAPGSIPVRLFQNSQPASVNDNFVGKLYFPMFWNRALTSDEVALIPSLPQGWLSPSQVRRYNPGLYLPGTNPGVM